MMSAKDMFYPEGKEFSKAEDRAYAREDLVYNVTEDILVALEDLEVSKKDLARKLGKSKSYVTQLLSGARNMTLGTLSDICFALDLTPKVIVNSELKVQSTNILIEESVESEWEKADSNHRMTVVGSRHLTLVEPQNEMDWAA
jgi:transcriptional regulator with XRE-family HTH domain